ncbi:hypothetical protein D1BOALGB6SA_10202 [Olavius sp. associated proteobacterium Delta 1]|nr:hypothetical protein D1BOALGB6SA_10202 [Olavius sp. associated proteobacterium Delta 1]
MLVLFRPWFFSDFEKNISHLQRGNDPERISQQFYTLTLHKFLSSSLAVMSEIVSFSGQMLDA